MLRSVRPSHAVSARFVLHGSRRPGRIASQPIQQRPVQASHPAILPPPRAHLTLLRPLNPAHRTPSSRFSLSTFEAADFSVVGASLLIGAAAALLWLSEDERVEAAELWSKDGRGIVEPASGMTFAPFIQRVEAPRQDLVALCVRKVWYVQTYALGVYVDTKGMLSGKALPTDTEYAFITPLLLPGAILRTLTDPETAKQLPYEVTLRLVPVRNTNSSHFSSAFVSALRATLKRGEDVPLIDGFKAAFPSAEFPKGTEVDISWKGGDIIVRVNGQKTGEMHNSQRVGAVLLGLYLSQTGKTPEDFTEAVVKQRWTQWKQT